ncbi:type II toxin-antitoxin system RelE/ParE family toxin [Thiolapillus sp.]
MIKSFRHKGLERYFLNGKKSGIQPSHADRLSRQLAVLNRATCPEDVNLSGWRLHPLQGDLKDHWSITVSGNWRLTFRFEQEDVILLDYQDYH